MTFESFLASDNAERPHFLLLGNPVEHSLSPVMHNTAARHYGMEARYHAVSLQEQELSRLASHFNNEQFRGANITIPYKEMVLPYLDEVDTATRKIGAVNTVRRYQHKLEGYNTDAYGFRKPLEPMRDRLEGHAAVIFGMGGAARAVIFALNELGMDELFLISRHPQRVGREFPGNPRVIGYDEWTAIAEDATLIVNTTPLGMDPHTETCPVRTGEKSSLQGKICYDIVYNPRKTRFLAYAGEVGCETIDGLQMLIHQGSRSFELWTGSPFPLSKVEDALNEYI